MKFHCFLPVTPANGLGSPLTASDLGELGAQEQVADVPNGLQLGLWSLDLDAMSLKCP